MGRRPATQAATWIVRKLGCTIFIIGTTHNSLTLGINNIYMSANWEGGIATKAVDHLLKGGRILWAVTAPSCWDDDRRSTHLNLLPPSLEIKSAGSQLNLKFSREKDASCVPRHAIRAQGAHFQITTQTSFFCGPRRSDSQLSTLLWKLQFSLFELWKMLSFGKPNVLMTVKIYFQSLFDSSFLFATPWLQLSNFLIKFKYSLIF